MNSITCTDDRICKNIDQENSTPDGINYECPEATCNNGKCNCPYPCLLDPHFGICIDPYKYDMTPSPTDTVPSPTETVPSPTDSVPLPTVPSDNLICTDNMMCMNIDQENSTPNNIVYECPRATCNNGKCDCSSDCILDTWSGVCVKNVVIGPTEVPQTGICIKTKISPTEEVCWKNVDGYIKDCTPDKCGININNMVRKFKTINGQRRIVYANEQQLDINKKLPVYAIVLIVIGAIILLLAIFYLWRRFK